MSHSLQHPIRLNYYKSNLKYSIKVDHDHAICRAFVTPLSIHITHNYITERYFARVFFVSKNRL